MEKCYQEGYGDLLSDRSWGLSFRLINMETRHQAGHGDFLYQVGPGDLLSNSSWRRMDAFLSGWSQKLSTRLG